MDGMPHDGCHRLQKEHSCEEERYYGWPRAVASMYLVRSCEEEQCCVKPKVREDDLEAEYGEVTSPEE